jgi:hypothetical protein
MVPGDLEGAQGCAFPTSGVLETGKYEYWEATSQMCGPARKRVHTIPKTIHSLDRTIALHFSKLTCSV